MQKTQDSISRNFIGGEWKSSTSNDVHAVFNPSTGQVLGKIPYAPKEEVIAAVDSAQQAFAKWKVLPISERVKYIFRMKEAFERHYEDLAQSNSANHGKTIVESRGDVRRVLDNIEAAIAVAYTLAKGETIDQIATDVDESMVREPLGVFSVIPPFNFPLMIPFWFIPYAIVLGDTIVVKPSEVTPIPMELATEIIEKEVKFPPGVLNVIHGSREVSEALITHPDVKGVSFVGSTAVAKHVFALAGQNGKRAIANGGAKNPIVVMPDADLNHTVPSLVSSFFGNAGQRCLAGANLVMVGKGQEDALDKFKKASLGMRIGNALDESTDLGPVVSENAKDRIGKSIEGGLGEGARSILDGRKVKVAEYPNGYYLGPTILDNVSSDMNIAKQEIFGPVASVIHYDDLDEAIEMINGNKEYGNMACIFTTNGRSARRFRREVDAGNIGINIGVAAPAAIFPFGGRKQSFFGTEHAQMDSVNFFTDRKVIISKW